MKICKACREPLEEYESMWCQACKICWDRERAQETVRVFTQLREAAENDDAQSVPDGFSSDCRDEICNAYHMLDFLS